MKQIEVEFYVSTEYVGSEVSETVFLQVPEDISESDLDKLLSEEFEIWMHENVSSGWSIK